jgi:hypothetical protein
MISLGQGRMTRRGSVVYPSVKEVEKEHLNIKSLRRRPKTHHTTSELGEPELKKLKRTSPTSGIGKVALRLMFPFASLFSFLYFGRSTSFLFVKI